LSRGSGFRYCYILPPPSLHHPQRTNAVFLPHFSHVCQSPISPPLSLLPPASLSSWQTRFDFFGHRVDNHPILTKGLGAPFLSLPSAARFSAKGKDWRGLLHFNQQGQSFVLLHIRVASREVLWTGEKTTTTNPEPSQSYIKARGKKSLFRSRPKVSPLRLLFVPSLFYTTDWAGLGWAGLALGAREGGSACLESETGRYK